MNKERICLAFKRVDPNASFIFTAAVSCVNFKYVHTELVLAVVCTTNPTNGTGCMYCSHLTREIVKAKLEGSLEKASTIEYNLYRARLSHVHFVSYTAAIGKDIYNTVEKPYDTQLYDFLQLPNMPHGSCLRMMQFFDAQAQAKYQCSYITQLGWVLRKFGIMSDISPTVFYDKVKIPLNKAKKGVLVNIEDDSTLTRPLHERNTTWYCSSICAAALRIVGLTELELDSPDTLFTQVEMYIKARLQPVTSFKEDEMQKLRNPLRGMPVKQSKQTESETGHDIPLKEIMVDDAIIPIKHVEVKLEPKINVATIKEKQNVNQTRNRIIININRLR